MCDDDPMNTWVMGEMLRSLNYKCTVVNNGEDCLKEVMSKYSLRCCRYKLLLIDFNMPFMSGLEVIKKIKESRDLSLL